jgi:hypothetical protein
MGTVRVHSSYLPHIHFATTLAIARRQSEKIPRTLQMGTIGVLTLVPVDVYVWRRLSFDRVPEIVAKWLTPRPHLLPSEALASRLITSWILQDS